MENGRPLRLTGDDVMRTIRARDPDEYPVMTAGQAHKQIEFDVSEPTVRKRMQDLAEDGKLKRAEVAGYDVYWPADEVMEPQTKVTTEADGETSPPEGEAVTDGGLSRGASILRDYTRIHPRSEQEASVLNEAADHLAMAGGVALAVLSVTVVHALVWGTDVWQPIGVAIGFAMIATVALGSLAVLRVLLLRVGWYAPTHDTDLADEPAT